MSEERSNVNPEALHLISNLQPFFFFTGVGPKHAGCLDIFANIVDQADLETHTTLQKIKSTKNTNNQFNTRKTNEKTILLSWLCLEILLQ